MTVAECENKIKSLLRAYKSTGHNNLSGRSALYLPFEEKLDEIFGTKVCPTDYMSHTINDGQSEVDPLMCPNSEEMSPVSSDKMPEPIPSTSSETYSYHSEKPSFPKHANGKIKKRKKTAMDIKKSMHAEKESNKNKRFERKVKIIEERERNKQLRHEERKVMHEELLKALKEKKI